MILTQWGSLYLGRLPAHTLLNGSVLSRGQRGTSSVYGATQRQECRLWRWQTSTHIPAQTLPVWPQASRLTSLGLSFPLGLTPSTLYTVR